MSTTELVAIIVSGVGAAFTGIGVVVRALRTATVDSSEILKAHNERLQARVRYLDAWKYHATLYIWRLRGEAARKGVETSGPPEELDLVDVDSEE